MQLSKKDLDVIYKYIISRRSQELSAFPIVNTIMGDELMPIIQEEHNRNIMMKDLLSLPQLVNEFKRIDDKIDSSNDTLTDYVLNGKKELDGKYSNITNELYSLIASLQVSGIALSQKFGYREDIGISQKTLTKAIGRLWEELGTITGKIYMDYTLTVEPSLIYSEVAESVVVTVDCSESISDFDSIKIYLNGELKAESHDVNRFTTNLTIVETSIIRAEGIIMGKLISKESRVSKHIPFFMGSGLAYTDIMNEECRKVIVGTLEGDYDAVLCTSGQYLFVIIPISRKEEFRRCKMDMNGFEIPFDITEMDDFIVCRSKNVYQAGTYNIDININS